MIAAVPVSNPSSDYVPIPHASATIAALADALRSEARLLGDLVNIMHLQRASVARDDIDGVDDSVFATHRVLVTLGEARRRRRSLNRLLGESDDLSLASLERFLGGAMPDEIRRSADVLADAARTLQREVDMNRRVLRHAIEAGEKFVRTLVDSAAPPPSTYPAAHGSPERSAGGAILDRRV